jgi:hypothetical protein
MVVSVGGGHGKEYCVGYSVFFLFFLKKLKWLNSKIIAYIIEKSRKDYDIL